MDTNELMELGAEKALREYSWDSIEYLFKPTNQGELLLRFDFHGTKSLLLDGLTSDAPDAMPFRFRTPYFDAWKYAIAKEEFYRKIKQLRKSQNEI